MISRAAEMADGTKIAAKSPGIINGHRVQPGSQNNVRIRMGDIDLETTDQMKLQARIGLGSRMTGMKTCEAGDVGRARGIAKPLHDFNRPDRCRSHGTCTNSHLFPALKLGTLTDILAGVNGLQAEGGDACPSIVAPAAANRRSPHGRPDMMDGMVTLPATAQLIQHKEEILMSSSTGMIYNPP